MREIKNEMKTIIVNLSQKYTFQSLQQRLEQRYGQNEEKPVEKHMIQEPRSEKYTEARVFHPDEVLFKDDAEYNLERISGILKSFPAMRNEMLGKKIQGKDYRVIFQCIDKFKDVLEKLWEKKNGIENGEKVAAGFEKLFDRTLRKIWEPAPEFSEVLVRYIRKWNLKLVCFRVGYKMADDDLEYLEENSLLTRRVPVRERERYMEVIEMPVPAVIIRYEHEDDLSEKVIPGVCRFYCKE